MNSECEKRWLGYLYFYNIMEEGERLEFGARLYCVYRKIRRLRAHTYTRSFFHFRDMASYRRWLGEGKPPLGVMP